MKTIHIKATTEVEDETISELMNILIKYGYKPEKYLGINSKIVMAKFNGGEDETTSTNSRY